VSFVVIGFKPEFISSDCGNLPVQFNLFRKGIYFCGFSLEGAVAGCGAVVALTAEVAGI
jgi:hypothetical protein